MDKPIAKKQRPASVRFALIAVGALAIVALIARTVAPIVKRWSHAETSLSGAAVHTAVVGKGDVVRDAPAQGRVIAARHPTLFSPSSGIVNLLVRAGATVKKGD